MARYHEAATQELELGDPEPRETDGRSGICAREMERENGTVQKQSEEGGNKKASENLGADILPSPEPAR